MNKIEGVNILELVKLESFEVSEGELNLKFTHNIEDDLSEFIIFGDNYKLSEKNTIKVKLNNDKCYRHDYKYIYKAQCIEINVEEMLPLFDTWLMVDPNYRSKITAETVVFICMQNTRFLKDTRVRINNVVILAYRALETFNYELAKDILELNYELASKIVDVSEESKILKANRYHVYHSLAYTAALLELMLGNEKKFVENINLMTRITENMYIKLAYHSTYQNIARGHLLVGAYLCMKEISRDNIFNYSLLCSQYASHNYSIKNNTVEFNEYIAGMQCLNLLRNPSNRVNVKELLYNASRVTGNINNKLAEIFLKFTFEYKLEMFEEAQLDTVYTRRVLTEDEIINELQYSTKLNEKSKLADYYREVALQFEKNPSLM